MHVQHTFTGRDRRRRVHPWVRTGDALARILITLGGVGTIAAVLLVGVFLFVVAAPLFRPARAQPTGVGPVASPAALIVGCDESGDLTWFVSGGEAAGGVTVVSIAGAEPLLERSAAAAGLEGCTVIRSVGSNLLSAAGYSDGSFRTGRLGLASSYLAGADLPAGLQPPAVGEALEDGDSLVVRGFGGQLARVALVTDLATPGGERLPEAVVDIDVTPLAGGPLVAALDGAGNVRVESATARRNMLTGKTTVVTGGGTIGSTAGFRPRFVRVSELGDQLYLIAADGAARRYGIRDVRNPRLMESFRVPGPVTAVARLFGGNALAVGTGAGELVILFAARPPAGTERKEQMPEDGLRVAMAREFPPVTRGITALAASPRSRLFAAADSGGGVRLLHSTAGREVVALTVGEQDLRPQAEGSDTGGSVHSGQPASPDEERVLATSGMPGGAAVLCIPPQENRLVAIGGGELAAWSVDVGYPEVSLRTLLLPVWYENYPAAGHAWETTGHEAFESKFGLLPLIFGTLKATVYSMLFATPIALLAAIYASQFMHPAWKARIKPAIEMMASLPSVVLGFIAGLIFAPLLERGLMPVLTGLFVVPLVMVAGAHLWLLLPAGSRARWAGLRFGVVALVALPLGVVAARVLAPGVETLLFQGDVRSWLDGRDGSGFGGWVVAMLPLAVIATIWLVGRVVNPWLRRVGAGWSQRRAGAASFLVFVGGGVCALTLALAAAAFCDAIRLDTRGGLFGTYVQRNALVVAVGMSFAIIPLVFTIADDALSSVPDHLRSASLGAGATPWQTAVRVIVPAAASGLFSAVMIGLGRAVGETMIVLMAAGNTPLVSWNLFNGFQTLSAAIATELPEAARGSSHYRVLFLAALALFAMTFVVNTVAEIVRQRFRRRAHEL
jgi:phosphate transport system permease protein